MNQTGVRRSQRRELTARMQVEYAGALPPGQVLAVVTRAELLVARTHTEPWSADLQEVCETVVRHMLARRVASHQVALSA
jgi:hypothetical protein